MYRYVNLKVFNVKDYHFVIFVYFQFCWVVCNVCGVNDIVVVVNCDVLF